MGLSHKSIAALIYYGHLLLNKDVPIAIFLFMSILQVFNWELYFAAIDSRTSFGMLSNIIGENFL